MLKQYFIKYKLKLFNSILLKENKWIVISYHKMFIIKRKNITLMDTKLVHSLINIVIQFFWLRYYLH